MNWFDAIARLAVKAVFMPAVLRWLLGQRVWAVAALTWRAAFRFRLFWVLAALLLLSVVGLPLLLKNDGTAQGFIQIMLTYTLSVVTALLAFSTLWLSCGTLARDIEECQMQVVAVKPIARWQIWLGKLLGITLLNFTLLAFSGVSIYGLLYWRARQLPEAQQRILHQEIFVARAALREPLPDLDAEVDATLGTNPEFSSLAPAQQQETRFQLKERIRATHQIVAPNHYRKWVIDLGLKRHLIGDEPLFLRAKFHVAQTNASGSYLGLWRIGPFENPIAFSPPQSLAPNTFHEVKLDSARKLLDDQGRLIINFENRNQTAVMFPLEDGLEVLYREGGFATNLARGLGIILCSLTLVAALGLAAASLMSFPVAAFFSISLLLVGLSSGTLTSVVHEGTVGGVDHESGAGTTGWIDIVLLPVFKAILWVVNLVQQFSPVDALSSGRTVAWGDLGLAFVKIVLLLGGILAALGMYFFTRRELAATQAHT